MADAEDDNIFPLVERRTPVADRLRDFGNPPEDNGDEESVLMENLIADEVTEAVQREEEDADDAAKEIASTLKTALAEKLEVEEDAIDDEYAYTVGTVIGAAAAEDVLTDGALEALGLMEDPDDDDSSTFSTDE